MTNIERVYNIPLRKEFLKAPHWKKTNRAVKAIRAFIKRHMKSDNIKIGRNLNKKMWERGLKNPPHHIKVTLIKEEDGLVKAELFGFKYEELTKDELEKQKEKEEKKAKKAADLESTVSKEPVVKKEEKPDQHAAATTPVKDNITKKQVEVKRPKLEADTPPKVKPKAEKKRPTKKAPAKARKKAPLKKKVHKSKK